LQLKIMETVTDAGGRFYFPAWGPLPVPILAGLTDRDPEIIMFKEGYKPCCDLNSKDSKFDYAASSTRTSWVDGKTIKLKRDGDLKAYAGVVGLIGTSLWFATHPQSPSCDWAYIPHMLKAVFRQEAIFRANKIYSSLPDARSIRNPQDCDPAARKILEDYIE
jgi:hypothetical protein